MRKATTKMISFLTSPHSAGAFSRLSGCPSAPPSAHPSEHLSEHLSEHPSEHRSKHLWPLLVPVLLGLLLCFSPSPATAEEKKAVESATPAPSSAEQSPAPAPVVAPEQSAWKELEPGLSYAEFDRDDASKSRIVVLRFAPEHFIFTLHMTSEDGSQPKTLRQWADRHDLVAAINASMYLTDGSTSTGHMRNGKHINNKRIVQRFGAFFVAAPDDPSLPSATMLERETENWEETLSRYKVAVQNYRMINAQRNILWSPGGPLYSISAVGQDENGQILFIHCREPIEAYNFASLLLHLPIKVRTVMYVEGGAQAGLALRTKGYSHLWGGRHPADFLVTGNVNAALPNVLGVKRRNVNKTPAIPDK